MSESLGRMHSRVTPLISALYTRLFARDPSIRQLFPAELVRMEQKLAHMLQLAIEGLGDPERLAPMLEDLGRRHVRYGVTAAHFASLEHALLESVAQFDADAWKPELERAWRRAFAFIESSMRRGMIESGTVVSGAARTKDDLPRQNLPTTVLAATPGRAPHLGYQVMGDGTTPIVVLLAGLARVEAAWDDPAIATFLRALSQTARLVFFPPLGAATTAGGRADAICAVMDSAGIARPAIVVGLGDAAETAALFAALEPDRVCGLVSFDGAVPALPRELPPAPSPPALVLPRALGEDVLASVDAIATFTSQLPSAASDAPPLSVVVVAYAPSGAIDRAARALGACAHSRGGAALGSAGPDTLAWAFSRGERALLAATAMKALAAESGLGLQLAVDVAWCERYPPAGPETASAVVLATGATGGEVVVSEAARLVST